MGQGKDALEVFAKFEVFQLMSTAKTYFLTINTLRPSTTEHPILGV